MLELFPTKIFETNTFIFFCSKIKCLNYFQHSSRIKNKIFELNISARIIPNFEVE